jgi:hypothetical protein
MFADTSTWIVTVKPLYEFDLGFEPMEAIIVEVRSILQWIQLSDAFEIPFHDRPCLLGNHNDRLSIRTVLLVAKLDIYTVKAEAAVS